MKGLPQSPFKKNSQNFSACSCLVNSKCVKMLQLLLWPQYFVILFCTLGCGQSEELPLPLWKHPGASFVLRLWLSLYLDWYLSTLSVATYTLNFLSVAPVKIFSLHSSAPFYSICFTDDFYSLASCLHLLYEIFGFLRVEVSFFSPRRGWHKSAHNVSYMADGSGRVPSGDTLKNYIVK